MSSGTRTAFQSTHRTQTMRLDDVTEMAVVIPISIHASYANDATAMVNTASDCVHISIHASYANDATLILTRRTRSLGQFQSTHRVAMRQFAAYHFNQNKAFQSTHRVAMRQQIRNLMASTCFLFQFYDKQSWIHLQYFL